MDGLRWKTGSRRLTTCKLSTFCFLHLSKLVLLTDAFRFEANKGVMSSSCEQWGVPSTTEQEMSDMSDAIQSIGQSSGVDPRFILAIVMQESNGCVRAPTTNYGVTNPGLMQSHDGTGSCNNGNVQNPCPKDEITQMIKDGTEGTSEGPGLKQLLSQAGSDDVTKYYKAARMYNSGSIASDGNLGQGIATHCYVSDIANRLMGWSTGPSSCNANSIGSLTSGSGSLPNGGVIGGGGSGGASPSSTTTAAPSPTIAPVTSVVPSPDPVTTTPVTTTTTTPPAPAITTSAPPAGPTPSSPSSSAPVYPHAATSCQKYYTVESGDYCLEVEAKVGITPSQLQGWNPGLDEACSNLWLGYQYCIQA